MSKRRFTAQEMREMSKHLISDICDTDNECNEYRNTEGSFDLADCESALRYSAGVVERCETIQRRFAMTKTESEMIDYIILGNAGKEEK